MPFFKEYNAADDYFPARPKGAPKMPQSSVAVFVKDAAIYGKLRLVLEHFGGSDFIMQYRTLH